MTKTVFVLSLALLSVCILSGCANPHFFPRTQPLFAGLNEENMSPSAKKSLAEAKTDFALARHGKAPQYAALTGSAPHSRSKVYVGKGYRLTLVKEDNVCLRKSGPAIVVLPTITGGDAYRYDEIDEVGD